jgi:hypothetical protein
MSIHPRLARQQGISPDEAKDHARSCRSRCCSRRRTSFLFERPFRCRWKVDDTAVMLSGSPLLVACSLCSLAVACGGDSGPPTDGLPADDSASAIGEFLATDGYLGSRWLAETASERERASSVSPHGRVRVHLNDVLRDSQRAGNGGLDGPPHTVGSMAVKELYDERGVVVGRAAILFSGQMTSGDTAVYYCVGPAGRCINGEPEFTSDEPAYGVGLETACGACHGGLVFTEVPTSGDAASD